MDARDHFKNGASSKSQMSRGHFFINKKFLLVLFTVVLSANYAQAQAQLKFGPQVGVNFTNKKITYLATGVSESVSTKMKPGFQVGGIVELDEGKKFVSQIGLLISSQKCVFEKNKFEEIGYLKDATLSVTYLRLPVHFVLKKDLGDMTFLASGGVYLGAALGGKVEDEKIEFGKKKLMPRFDSGINLGPGLQFGNLQATLEYSFGFWSNEANSVTKYTFNNGFALNLRYLFSN